MMEMLRTLVKDKGKATGLGKQSSAAHSDQRREELVYPSRFTLLYAQTQPMPQMGGFSYGYAPLSVQMNEIGQNSRANMANPIAIPNLDDLKE